MELVQIYECLCDRTRLRILHLLSRGPLCVCHLQEILGESQVKISKHLGYLKSHGLVQVRREGNWRIYHLVEKPTRALRSNLACLQDCAQEDDTFRRDLRALKLLQAQSCARGPTCSPSIHRTLPSLNSAPR